MERSQTAYVILGILAIHDNQSGYEIRKTIQQSVGFFWGESYGQIYPTLKRLPDESACNIGSPSLTAMTHRATSFCSNSSLPATPHLASPPLTSVTSSEIYRVFSPTWRNSSL